jgi:phosphatidylglycerol:prolipoprotein diacylglycerol transferase
MEYIFHIGRFGLRWYSVLIATGLLVGAWVASIEAKRRGESPDHVYNALLLALPLALIGARAYHVIDKWNEIYKYDPFRVLLINEGGIGIYGAVAGSILALAIYTRWKKLRFGTWIDIGAPGLIIGQAIGRWGNYFNQELYGKPTDLPWGIYIPPDKRILGYEGYSDFHPLFLYESLLNLAAFGAMMVIARRFHGRLKPGDMGLLYGVFYGAVRMSLETLRIGNWVWGAGVPVATAISAGAILLCGGALLYRHVRAPKKDAGVQGQAPAA